MDRWPAYAGPSRAAAPEGGDILSGDRERRSRGIAARFPFLRLFSGRVLAFLAAGMVVFGLGLAFVRNGTPEIGYGFGQDYAPAPAGPHPEAGRALRGSKRCRPNGWDALCIWASRGCPWWSIRRPEKCGR